MNDVKLDKKDNDDMVKMIKTGEKGSIKIVIEKITK